MPNRRLKLAVAAFALALSLAPATADAQYYPQYDGRYDDGRDAYRARNGYQRGDHYADNGYYARDDYGRGGRRNGRSAPVYAGPPVYRDDDPRSRVQRRCDKGTGGTILGAIAGGLLGNAAAGRGDRGAGTIVGAGVGALAGRAIDRDC